MEKKFNKLFVDALIHFAYNFFIYLLFIVPFDLWKKAIFRLSEARENKSLSINKINSLWPFLSFIKVFFFEFLLDGLIFIIYVLALPVAVYFAITNEGQELTVFFAALLCAYYSPLCLSLYRDILQLLMLPLKKFISWAVKPAQYLDLTIKNK